MADISGIPVKHISNGGVINHGEGIHFTLETTTGAKMTFLLDRGYFSRFTTTLHTLLKLADDERAKVNPIAGKAGDAQGVSPFTIHSYGTACGRDPKGKAVVLLRVQAREPVSFDVAMPVADARGLAESLAGAADESEASGPRKLN